VTEEQVGQGAGVPAYADSLRATLGDEAGRAFLADAAARASELAAQARALFAAWLALAQSPDDARRAPAR
jgi:hypothetical protein